MNCIVTFIMDEFTQTPWILGSLQWVSKACGCYLVTFLDRTPIFVSCMVFGEDKKRNVVKTHKKETCEEIGQHLHILLITPHSIMNTIKRESYVFTLIIPICVCGTKSWNMCYFAKSQNQWGLKFILSDIKFLNTCLFTIHFKKISAWFKVL